MYSYLFPSENHNLSEIVDLLYYEMQIYTFTCWSVSGIWLIFTCFWL